MEPESVLDVLQGLYGDLCEYHLALPQEEEGQVQEIGVVIDQLIRDNRELLLAELAVEVKGLRSYPSEHAGAVAKLEESGWRILAAVDLLKSLS